ncbi:hypothetical protein [Kitasatospora purpeofusca]|uniref:hypothetical protein n=1 Tax=Kitasatospora purpeofusca TaxID=67352 RepID=UPI0022502648|nr:hypothetical protein [Kitasatospora purpeofusca]MCX4753666.1 hypothetical protein [Kitasatospora purpeofusca]WSR33153.1 hypothetical protein OG715_20425 [Kitasatospora purpeofusca]
MNSPLESHDPYLRTCTEPEVTSLIRELHERGKPFGIRWGSVAVNGATVDGRLLVDFGDTSVATLLNLLALLREAAQE